MQTIWQNCLRRAAFGKLKAYELLLRLVTSVRYKNKNERKKMFKQLRYQAERKYLSRYLPADVASNEKKYNLVAPKIIWTCWWQGEENMPPLVKRCIESIHKHCSDYELRIITTDNMADYIKLPDYIWQKHQKGYVSRAHLADILRLSLLEKYGGIWMDATIFLTAPLPEVIINSPFFSYHCHELYQGQIWLLKAASHNVIISGLRNLLLRYWKNENRVTNYFFAYTLWDLLLDNNAECAAQWAKMPLVYDDCYELADNFFEPYSEAKWAAIKAQTPVHKLSWKYKKEPAENSFLQYLLDGKLEN